MPKIANRISKSDLFPDIAELMVVMGMCSLLKPKSFKSPGLFIVLGSMVGLGVEEY